MRQCSCSCADAGTSSGQRAPSFSGLTASETSGCVAARRTGEKIFTGLTVFFIINQRVMYGCRVTATSQNHVGYVRRFLLAKRQVLNGRSRGIYPYPGRLPCGDLISAEDESGQLASICLYTSTNWYFHMRITHIPCRQKDKDRER